MSEFVVIRLAADDQPVQWVLVDSNGTRRSSLENGSLQDAAAAIGQHPVIVLVPAEDVVSTTVNIPARSSARIRTALPFALEEDLAEDVEDLHFAAGNRQENSRLPVAIAAIDKMDSWLQQLADAGIEPVIMTPANHGVAKIPGTMSIIVDEDHTVMFNDGADTHFIMQNIKPSDALVLAGKLGEQQDEAGEKTGHLIVFCTSEANERLSHDWIALRNELDSVDVNVLPDGVLPKLAVTVAAGHGVNLLQGKYGKKTEYAALFRPWKLAATLLVGFAASWMLFKGVAYYQMLDEKDALLAQFTTEYRAIRPNDTSAIEDPAAMVNSLRRSVGGPSAPQVFLPSIRQIGDALSGNSGAVLEAVSYRAGVIDLRLTAPNVSTLDNIQKAISASGRFNASIQRTDQVADKIDGRIQIRESGS